MTHRERYRNNPEYRERQLARVKARHAENKQDPTYRRLLQIRKKICDRRYSIERFQNRIVELERNLFSLIRKRDQLSQMWKEKRRNR